MGRTYDMSPCNTNSEVSRDNIGAKRSKVITFYEWIILKTYSSIVINLGKEKDIIQNEHCTQQPLGYRITLHHFKVFFKVELSGPEIYYFEVKTYSM